MSVKPILFNTEMVRAILDGRKSCTRRSVSSRQFLGMLPDKCKNAAPDEFLKGKRMMFKPYCDMTDAELIMTAYKAPYEPGDILYVRETVWQKIGYYLDIDGETKPSWYNEFKYVASDEKPETGWNYSWAKRPSIHMPKEAARIWLKVTDVRVERLQEITENGAKAEGISEEWARSWWIPTYNDPDSGGYPEYRDTFAYEVWDSTIKKSDLDRYGWDANPYVFVIEFIRIDKPEEI